MQTRSTFVLPDKPSIAVLPFSNLSGDPKEDYFSDGITEDIMTELSRRSVMKSRRLTRPPLIYADARVSDGGPQR
jgi:TolB-like protein